MSSSSKKASRTEERTTGFRVISESYPSGRGCYYGQELDEDYIRACTNTTVVGEYDTMREAKRAAIAKRNATCEFDDWAEEFYGRKAPPYYSDDGDNYDDDETVAIYIVDISKELAEKEKAMKKARASAPPKKTKSTTKPKASTKSKTKAPSKAIVKPADRKFGHSVTDTSVIDTNIFLRNPCRLRGGESHHPGVYGNGETGKNSLVYLMQRISDRNYAMRSFCLEGTGAEYTSFKRRNVIDRCVAWMPNTNLNNHSKNETILDACHTDLVQYNTGRTLLTAESLVEGANPDIECMFIHGYCGGDISPKDIVRAIEACPNLRCISLTETVLSDDVLTALASCAELRGILLSMPDNESPKATDAGLAAIFRSCPKLSWVFIDCDIFDTESWRALADGACPDLEVLWVDSTMSENGRYDVARGDHNIIRAVLAERKSDLKLLMINPDTKLNSRHHI